MYGRLPALALGAFFGLSLPGLVFAQTATIAVGSTSRPVVQMAQYDGPQDFGGQDQGYGAPPGMGGPPPGYGRGQGYGPGSDEDPGYRTRRRNAQSQGAGGPQRVNYHGFRIDLSQGGVSGNLTSEIASIEHQVDIVDEVGLSVSDLRLFRSLPIKIANGLNGGGHYNGGSTVQMGNLLVSDPRPVLLHEYMHVYHSRMSGGFQNPEIRAFYEEAMSRNLYPEGSYMLKNQGEFFAMTASCYLYGTVARPPYNRDTIRTQQPDYYAFLGHIFGAPGMSHSAGSAQGASIGQGQQTY